MVSAPVLVDIFSLINLRCDDTHSDKTTHSYYVVTPVDLLLSAGATEGRDCGDMCRHRSSALRQCPLLSGVLRLTTTTQSFVQLTSSCLSQTDVGASSNSSLRHHHIPIHLTRPHEYAYR